MSETFDWECLQARARVLRAIRAFFEARGFLEVETPSPDAAVTVRVGGAAPGLVLACPDIDPALRFEPAGRLEVRADGLWLLPAPGYRLSVR